MGTPITSGNTAWPTRVHNSVVGRAGFEPAKTQVSRFTVCPGWPLRYRPTLVAHKTTLCIIAWDGGDVKRNFVKCGNCDCTSHNMEVYQNYTPTQCPTPPRVWAYTLSQTSPRHCMTPYFIGLRGPAVLHLPHATAMPDAGNCSATRAGLDE
ncbi:MAG: hypothetical protein RL076_2599 [Chloroflexota bacterium]